jgi:hypothetical protein
MIVQLSQKNLLNFFNWLIKVKTGKPKSVLHHIDLQMVSFMINSCIVNTEL